MKMFSNFYLLFHLLIFLLPPLFLYLSYHKRRSYYVNNKDGVKFKGTVVLMKKHVLDMTNIRASIVDRVYEIFGRRVSFQLVSATVGDPNDRDMGKVGEPAYIEGWITRVGSLYADEIQFAVDFVWDEKTLGLPGAVIVKNHHKHEFLLKRVTVEGIPGKGRVHFVCNSWVYPAYKYSCDRIFFANDTYLPSGTPKPLMPYREDELRVLRGNGAYGKLQEHDRVYDYDVYNDLGDPSRGKEHERPVLGGSKESPYPRRGRTGRPLTNGDYLPCDEYFGHLKYSDFIASKLKADKASSVKGKGEEEFSSFKDVMDLYKGSMEMPSFISKIIDWIPFETIKELLRTDGNQKLFTFPLPQVISKDDDKSALWSTDKEFARQMIAGLHPVLIRAAKEEEIREFNKRPERVSNQMEASDDEDEDEDGWLISATKEKEEGDDNKRFFILDHSYLKEYQRKIYELTSNKVYASKTLVYLEKDGTLSPRGIMLIDAVGEDEYVQRFYYPAEDGVNGALWRIAKAFVAVNDSGHHQLVSHWLYTHAAIEPFVIATNRQLSVMHPIYKLLNPHYRDTMNMNSLARQLLIHANGPVERNFFPGKFAMSLTSEIYKSWNLMDHALPTDLCKRGVAAMENNKTLRLLISDYPYAVDGLEIYCAIQNYVSSYSSLYYTTDISLQCDVELQTWWTELRELGHGDLKHEPWWPNMQTLSSLTEVCTILIWLASAYHASLNFGQYAYAGFVPNRPTFIRHPMPDPKEYDEIENDPEGLLLKSITSKAQALSVMSVLEILSMHSSDEVYIGQREDKEWTSDRRAVEVFERFREELVRIEKRIDERNKDERLKNRIGEVGVAYTLLYPSTSDFRRVAGISGRGVPNSVSV